VEYAATTQGEADDLLRRACGQVQHAWPGGRLGYVYTGPASHGRALVDLLTRLDIEHIIATVPAITRGVTHALNVCRITGDDWDGSVEQWRARYGDDTIAAMETLGLIERDPSWSGCLRLTERGEWLAELATTCAASGYYLRPRWARKHDVMDDASWAAAAVVLTEALASSEPA